MSRINAKVSMSSGVAKELESYQKDILGCRESGTLNILTLGSLMMMMKEKMSVAHEATILLMVMTSISVKLIMVEIKFLALKTT